MYICNLNELVAVKNSTGWYLLHNKFGFKFSFYFLSMYLTSSWKHKWIINDLVLAQVFTLMGKSSTLNYQSVASFFCSLINFHCLKHPVDNCQDAFGLCVWHSFHFPVYTWLMYLYGNESMGIWLFWVKVACYMEEFENHIHWWLSSAYVV